MSASKPVQDISSSSYTRATPSPALLAHRNIVNNKEKKEEFIRSEVDTKDDTNSESESESGSDEEACKVIIPKKKRSKENTSQELLRELLSQHKEVSKLQKKMYQLQSELDKEEISCRYTKLDLANAQARVIELREKILSINKNNDIEMHKMNKKLYMMGAITFFMFLFHVLYFARYVGI